MKKTTKEPYEIVLIDGTVITGVTTNMQLIIDEYLHPDENRVWIIREIGQFNSVTCIRRNRVSHIRLPDSFINDPL